MDLSRLKWPIIILVVVGAGWLLTAPGINYMHTRFTSGQPGVDPARDLRNEAGLSRLGGFLVKTFRYEKGYQVLNDACTLYPGGPNFWNNQYRMAKCLEKMGNYHGAVQTLQMLMGNNANAIDARVPGFDVLKLRTDKLIEVHGLGEIR